MSIKKKTFRDKDGNLIEEGDILIIDTDQKEYQVSLVHWDWRREELGVIPFIQTTKRQPRSEWLAAFASCDEYNENKIVESCSKIVVKHNVDNELTNRDSDPEVIYSGGMPVPKMTRKQAEQIDSYDEYYKDCSGNHWNEKIYMRKMRALVKKLKRVYEKNSVNSKNPHLQNCGFFS